MPETAAGARLAKVEEKKRGRSRGRGRVRWPERIVGPALLALGSTALLAGLYLFGLQVSGSGSGWLLGWAALLSFGLLGPALAFESPDQLDELARRAARLKTLTRVTGVQLDPDLSREELVRTLDSLLERLEQVLKENKEQTVQLMLYARDLAESHERIRRELELRNRLSRYVDESLVEKLVQSREGVFFDSEKLNLTVLFADIRSFTALTERMGAEEVVAMLNEFFGEAVESILDREGVLNKFVGDQVLGLFGLLSERQEAAMNAVRAALEMHRRTAALMERRRRRGQETFQIGVGIDSGEVIVGNVGSEHRMDYTVIGDTVNVAALLQETACGGETIIGEGTYRQVQEKFRTEPRGEIHSKNRERPIRAYRVIDPANQA